jgi:hypothetical protein
MLHFPPFKIWLRPWKRQWPPSNQNIVKTHENYEFMTLIGDLNNAISLQGAFAM